jgi:hypothetical protein
MSILTLETEPKVIITKETQPMKTSFIRNWLSPLLVVGGITCFSIAQVPIEVPQRKDSPLSNQIFEERRVSFDPYLQWLERGSVGKFDVEQEWSRYLLQKSKQMDAGTKLEAIANAMHKAKNVGDEPMLAQLDGELEKVVAEQFDSIHGDRDKELDRLEKTLVSLREMQKKRLAQRDQIIADKIAQMKRDLDGLGWIAPPTSPAQQLRPTNSGQQMNGQQSNTKNR